jgi:hypothetical protein
MTRSGERNERFIGGSVFGGGSSWDLLGFILQRFVCWGSPVVRGGRDTPVRTEPCPTILSDALCRERLFADLAPVEYA